VIRYSYLAVLAVCLLGTLPLELFLKVNVYRRWRRLVLTLLPVAALFAAWDIAAIRSGHWSFDARQMTGIVLPGGLPVEELLFFLAIPVCAILAFEAVRAVRGWRAGDEP
jgi:lycopene cyclase domain-containing protein